MSLSRPLQEIELFPSFTSDGNYIYTCIENDTNGNGITDLDDRSVIYFRDAESGSAYPLTLPSETSFAARWFPVFPGKTYKGVILYSGQKGENINIELLPESGIIPRKKSAAAQYDLAEKYMTEYNDEERYRQFQGRGRDSSGFGS